ncbi:MAG: hypothetical protein ACJ763_07830 [Bdellovibrionia bacterium]
MKDKNAFNLMRIAIAALAFALTSPTLAAPRASRTQCLRAQLLEQLQYKDQRPQALKARISELETACKNKEFNLCKDTTLSLEQKTSLLHAAAHLDNTEMRAAYLNSFPPKNQAELERLHRYIEERLRFCQGSVHQTCDSERWELVIEDYLAREEKFPGAKYLARWNEDRLESRIPGLYDFLHERAMLEGFSQDPKAYETLLHTPGLTADSISIVSEQAMKKKLNDVNKGLSDALGEMRLRSFRWHLQNTLAEEGLKLPNASRVDFKTDRILEPLIKLQQEQPRKLERAVNLAAARANGEMRMAVYTRFPELMYITDMYEPSRWFNTASFSMPGYSARLNEALASFKARLMREAPALDNEAARDQFVSFAKGAIEFADLLKNMDAYSAQKIGGIGKLQRAGIIDSNGAFTRKTAEIIRKLKPGVRLSNALTETFKVPVTEMEQKLILLQWARQDMLSLPLSTIDKMPEAPKNVAILGGDGIAGGAIDGWTKLQALLAHRDAILNQKLNPDQQVQNVFHALVEADNNASAMIRSAPEILKQSLNRLPVEVRKSIGMSEVHTSADDAVAPLSQLKDLAPAQRDSFYRGVAWNVSQTTRTVQLRQKNDMRNAVVGPEILRMFLGFDKAGAEAAEQFLKPIEEKLSTANFLGPNWRAQYPDVALFAANEGGKKFKVYIAGKSIDSNFETKCREALKSLVRGSEYTEPQFVLQPH